MGRIQEPPKMSKDFDNATVKGCSELIVAFALGLLICLVISLCASCKPQKELQIERVEVPVVVTQEHTIESVKIDHVRDTLIQRDSVYHYIKGDTMVIERWHHTQGTTTTTRVDTLHIYDSIPYPVQTTHETIVTKIQEVNILKWWQKALMVCGGIALVVFGFLIAYKIGKKKS
jgi:hypothetical protein